MSEEGEQKHDTIKVIENTGENENEIHIEGPCTLKSKSNNYDGTYLTHDEMQTMVNKVVGIPLLREHEGKSLGLGIIKSAKIDENNRLYINASLNRDSFSSIKTINDIKEGKITGFSIRSKCNVYKNENTGELKTRDKEIPEISVVEHPDVDHARIKFISNDHEKFTRDKNNLLNILNENKNLKNYNKNLFNKLDLINNNKFNFNHSSKGIMSSENEKNEKNENSSSINKEEKEKEEEFKLQGPPETQEEKPQETKKPEIELPKDPEKLKEYFEHLIKQNIEKDKLLKQYETNPGEMKRLKEQQEAKDLKWAKKMEENVPDIVDYLVANAKRIGEDPNNINVQAVIDTLKNATKEITNIDAIKPIYQVLAHAKAATQKSQTEQEALYQALKSQSQKDLKSVKDHAADNDEKWRIFMQNQESDNLQRRNLKRVQENAPPSSYRKNDYYNSSKQINDEDNKKVKLNEQSDKEVNTGRSIHDFQIPENCGNIVSPLSDHFGYGLYSSGGTELDDRQKAMVDAIRINMWDSSRTGHQDMQMSGFRFIKNAPRGPGFDADTGELTSKESYVKFE